MGLYIKIKQACDIVTHTHPILQKTPLALTHKFYLWENEDINTLFYFPTNLWTMVMKLA